MNARSAAIFLSCFSWATPSTSYSSASVVTRWSPAICSHSLARRTSQESKDAPSVITFATLTHRHRT
jgi:hypothetical protein